MSIASEKVYVEILRKLKTIIQEGGLQAGDKLPSERVLAHLVQAGRSSVREALRSLELLGLIETKRGEGTFIRPPSQHRLVEVLASFVLHDDATVKDLLQTRAMVIKECLSLGAYRMTREDEQALTNLLTSMKATEDTVLRSTLSLQFQESVIGMCGNQLLYRLWVELTSYEASLPIGSAFLDYDECMQLLQHLKNKDSDEAWRIFSRT
ncbi:GntR family transcriptional regulator [Fictibacillus macauensis ZFHKF-1]|uniref:GntR family transcriptional regulator n=1 Tax=Fictibacillus macauensis ZFHKF-1 TaxID=1196324 RepID=I8AIZ0_9BACL|nr:GntR family transcriptional regulator [Fictibacillus macauensis]EIT85444.1 GntR family transcriptional regulator [Fictibacillus macauensis ZFHKF-1]